MQNLNTLTNKDRLRYGAKVLLVVIVAFLGIISCSGAISHGTATDENFFTVCGALGLASLAFSTFILVKYLFKNEK
ncbi:MAG: hypothetical protein K6E37_05905 [Bacteroidales bacterium]|nr:hypothetical protein [Bacteroidales bacterium]